MGRLSAVEGLLNELVELIFFLNAVVAELVVRWECMLLIHEAGETPLFGLGGVELVLVF